MIAAPGFIVFKTVFLKLESLWIHVTRGFANPAISPILVICCSYTRNVNRQFIEVFCGIYEILQEDLEVRMKVLEHQLNIAKFKVWYSNESTKQNDELAVVKMVPSKLPEHILELYQLSHASTDGIVAGQSEKPS